MSHKEKIIIDRIKANLSDEVTLNYDVHKIIEMIALLWTIRPTLARSLESHFVAILEGLTEDATQ